MDCDLKHCDPKSTAWVFPGQGAHCASMLDAFHDASGFRQDYERILARLGDNPFTTNHSSEPALTGNAASSLLTVFASVLALRKLRQRHPDFVPAAVGGYSVGQWTALYAAGMITWDRLIELVFQRAKLMDACLSNSEPYGMLAVIGVRDADVRAVCEAVTVCGHRLEIANENAPGQYTLGGTITALSLAEERLHAHQPKRLVRLPVTGPWHTSFLQPAVAPLKSLLLGETFSPPICPVVDNTTGNRMRTDHAELCETLSRHVAAPVRWFHCVKTLESVGVRDIIEVGYGDVLTRFGFFITRRVRHRAMISLPRPPQPPQSIT